MKLEELLSAGGITQVYRLRNAETKRSFRKSIGCYIYARVYTLEGAIDAPEATRILTEVLQSDPKKRNISFEWSRGGRAVLAYWQADE